MFFTREDYKKIENWLKNRAIKDTEFLNSGAINGSETIVVVQNGKNKKMYIKDLVIDTSSFNPVYISNILDKTTKMPTSYGSLKEGTTVKDIEGLSYNKLFDLILFGTINDTPDTFDFINISPTNKTVSANGESFSVNILSSTEWFIENLIDWVSVSKNSGINGDTITVSISENQNPTSRSTSITFKCGSSFASLNIIQLGKTSENPDIPEDPEINVIYPTFVEPSVKFQRKGITALFEIGAPALTKDDFSIKFDKGGIYLNGVFQDYRSGELDEEKSFIYINGIESSKELPEVFTGNTTYTYRAYFKEGPQPKDSNGNNYNYPLQSGYVDSDLEFCHAVYPWFASTEGATADSIVKQKLKSNVIFTDPVVLQSTVKCPQVFELPEEITELQVLEPMSNTYVKASLDVYNKTEIVKNLGGVEKTYYRYEYDSTEYGDRGEITLRINY